MRRPTPSNEEHFEAFLADGDGRWKRVETDPYSGMYSFDVEQDAIDQARKLGGEETGFVVMKVVRISSIAWEGGPAPAFE